MDATFTLVLLLGAAILAVVALIESGWRNWTAWAVLALAVYLLVGRL